MGFSVEAPGTLCNTEVHTKSYLPLIFHYAQEAARPQMYCAHLLHWRKQSGHETRPLAVAPLMLGFACALVVKDQLHPSMPGIVVAALYTVLNKAGGS